MQQFVSIIAEKLNPNQVRYEHSNDKFKVTYISCTSWQVLKYKVLVLA